MPEPQTDADAPPDVRRQWTIAEAIKLAKAFADLRNRRGIVSASAVWLLDEIDDPGDRVPPPWQYPSFDVPITIDRSPQPAVSEWRAPEIVIIEAPEPPWIDWILWNGLTGYGTLTKTDFRIGERFEGHIWLDPLPARPLVNGAETIWNVKAQFNGFGISRLIPFAIQLLKEVKFYVSRDDLQPWYQVGCCSDVEYLAHHDWFLAVFGLAEHEEIPSLAIRNQLFLWDMPAWCPGWSPCESVRRAGDWEINLKPPTEAFPNVAEWGSNGRPWFHNRIDDFLRASELTCLWIAEKLRTAAHLPADVQKENRQARTKRRRGKELELVRNAACMLSDKGMTHEQIAVILKYKSKSAISDLINKQ